MTPVTAGLLGALAGLAVGLVVASVIWSGRARRVATDALAADHTALAIAQLRSVAAIVGPDGSVLAASGLARGSGLVRGSVVLPAEVRSLFAATPRRPRAVDVDLPRGPEAAPLRLSVRVIPLPDGTSLVLGEDRAADQRFDDARRDFVANITHELKTPIGAILLLAEAVEAAAADPSAVTGFAGKITKEASRLNELVSQIIALSRLQSKDPLLSAEEVALDEIVGRSVDRCRELAAGKDIAINLSGESAISVIGDGEQLEAAVTNLVQNAVAYSEPGARVTVTVRRRGPETDPKVELSVSDTGIGIAPDDLARVFERFYRVDQGRSRAHGGTGLGLSIVKHVAQAHGGEVSAWSQPGQGSTFTIRLPALSPADEQGRPSR